MSEALDLTITAIEPEGLDDFLDAYVRASLWSSTDNSDETGGETLDRHHGPEDISGETLDRMRADCIKFLNDPNGGRLICVAGRLEAEGQWSLPHGAGCSVVAYAGHDFWLTRNGHGSGFWDGDWPKGIAEGLHALAKRFGPFDLFLGDDGRIHGA